MRPNAGGKGYFRNFDSGTLFAFLQLRVNQAAWAAWARSGRAQRPDPFFISGTCGTQGSYGKDGSNALSPLLPRASFWGNIGA
jgi:hypothetical protein